MEYTEHGADIPDTARIIARYNRWIEAIIKELRQRADNLTSPSKTVSFDYLKKLPSRKAGISLLVREARKDLELLLHASQFGFTARAKGHAVDNFLSQLYEQFDDPKQINNLVTTAKSLTI